MIRKFSEILGKIEELLVVAGTVLVTVLVFLNVVMRNVFKLPLSWPDELGRYLLIFIIYYGYVIAIRKVMEIKIDVILTVFPRYRRQIFILSNVFGMLFSLAIVILGFKYAKMKYFLGSSSVILNLPEWFLITLFLVIGGLMMGFRYLENILAGLKLE